MGSISVGSIIGYVFMPVVTEMSHSDVPLMAAPDLIKRFRDTLRKITQPRVSA